MAHQVLVGIAYLFDASASSAPFVPALDRFKRPVVIDWGFPPECLNTVRKLSEERGTIPMGLFDIQTRKIEVALSEINSLFRSHVEYTLPSAGIYTPPDKIWKACWTL